MAFNKVIDSLYGELSLAKTGSDGGMSADVLRAKSLRTRMRVRMARLVVSKYPNVVESILVRPYVNKGYEVVGYGFQSTVIRSNDEVMKILRRSTAQDDAWRRSIVDDFNQRQQVATEYIGDFLVPQHFAVEPHPVFPRKEVVVARQPLVTYQVMDDVLQPAATTSEQLRIFAERGLSLSSEQQLAPDILGAQNIVLHGEKVSLLDTVPMRRSENPTGFDKTVAFLTEMAKAAAN